ncbi:hypothetical protein [Amycolatopsis albispora]|uniref:Uncharacterized protein n=1 Tax=Amycolatopsis albispora TaxID=1804986 RepID=A0A344LGK9_9PSEU|nr:hypothetical protein [Amycolatopsis albispora]AXB47183.1 hypothetical protein A4R43_35970 [Amycolatopsis albispora]
MIGQSGSSPGRVASRWREVAVAAVTGVLVVLAVWLVPGVLGVSGGTEATVVRATVTKPLPCTNTGAREGVRVEIDGQRRDATLSACGHNEGEQFDVALPADVGPGPLEVRIAPPARGDSALMRPVALGLLSLSCLAGGGYAWLVVRGPRRRPVLI